MKANLLILLSLILLSSCSSSFMLRTLEKRGKLAKDTITIRDTITVRDTIYIPESKPVTGEKDLDSLLNGGTLKVEDSNVVAETKIVTDPKTGKKKIQTTAKAKEKILYRTIRVPYEKKVPVTVACPGDGPFWEQWWFWTIFAQTLIIILLLKRPHFIQV